MLYDINSLFSGAIAADGTRSDQAITATAVSTNVMDTRQPNGTPTTVLFGNQEQSVYLHVLCTQAFNNLTSLTITLESAANRNLTSSTVHFTSIAIPLLLLTAGAALVRIPLPVDSYQRYVGLRFTVAGTAPTNGAVIAMLTMDPNPLASPAYPGSFTVDV